MRAISQRTWMIINELREKASPAYRAREKSTEDVQQEARERLAELDYADRPLTASPALLATLGRDR